jgi:hypothetical protein
VEVDLDPAELAKRYGADLPVPEWAARLDDYSALDIV